MRIRTFRREDAGEVLSMMRELYASPAVSSSGSDEIFRRDIAACLDPGANLEGFVLTEADETVGYAMTTASFSTEHARSCIWIEDLFIRSGWRDRGFGSQFLTSIAERHPESLLRLEVSPENKGALEMYKRSGFRQLPYIAMKRLPT